MINLLGQDRVETKFNLACISAVILIFGGIGIFKASPPSTGELPTAISTGSNENEYSSTSVKLPGPGTYGINLGNDYPARQEVKIIVTADEDLNLHIDYLWIAADSNVRTPEYSLGKPGELIIEWLIGPSEPSVKPINREEAQNALAFP